MGFKSIISRHKSRPSDQELSKSYETQFHVTTVGIVRIELSLTFFVHSSSGASGRQSDSLDRRRTDGTPPTPSPSPPPRRRGLRRSDVGLDFDAAKVLQEPEVAQRLVLAQGEGLGRVGSWGAAVVTSSRWNARPSHRWMSRRLIFWRSLSH